MENTEIVKKPSLAKSTLPYGITFGLILFVEFIISYAFGLNSAENKMIGVIMFLFNNILFPFLFILLACNNYKNKINGGYISFGESLKAGVSVSVIAAAVSSITTSLFYIIIPEAKTQILEQTKVSLAAQPGMTAEGMKMALKMTEIFTKPYVMIPFSILIYAFIGLIISLIVGAIVKKDNPGAFN
ncbi:DUF4199 domain-containing protein [Flavobacterium sp. NRK1]|uniref:DUF4199 domain-containing protein n=1 Tax=Flavobacterium sp. NRK1 TaxID=2954929 RepID=UPI0020932090|nr:DUF4199 domain-containing protein [Flavobacterium sp. NRK1]MCO6148499.1 DUF4199 domain-containing protein [Flavobacterium sp. NRK1]